MSVTRRFLSLCLYRAPSLITTAPCLISTKVSIGNSALMRNTNAAMGATRQDQFRAGFEVSSQDLILASDHL